MTDTELDTKTSLIVDELCKKIYPIGSIYMSSDPTNPSQLFGGTWEQIKDKFLLACGDTYSNGSTGGSANAVTVSHSHNFTNGGSVLSAHSTNALVKTGFNTGNMWQNRKLNAHGVISSSGESGTGKNMPPYLAIYTWKRTA